MGAGFADHTGLDKSESSAVLADRRAVCRSMTHLPWYQGEILELDVVSDKRKRYISSSIVSHCVIASCITPPMIIVLFVDLHQAHGNAAKIRCRSRENE